jgi:hypothetical protein
VPAQIREDDAIASAQDLGYGKPELMIRGKRMQQDDGRAVAEGPVGNFGVAARDAMGGHGLHEGN